MFEAQPTSRCVHAARIVPALNALVSNPSLLLFVCDSCFRSLMMFCLTKNNYFLFDVSTNVLHCIHSHRKLFLSLNCTHTMFFVHSFIIYPPDSLLFVHSLIVHPPASFDELFFSLSNAPPNNMPLMLDHFLNPTPPPFS